MVFREVQSRPFGSTYIDILAKYCSRILYEPRNKGLMQNKESQFGFELLL